MESRSRAVQVASLGEWTAPKVPGEEETGAEVGVNGVGTG